MDSGINNSQYSDVTFIVQGGKVFAHKAILLSRCSYFERLFGSDFKEKEQVMYCHTVHSNGL